MSAGKTYYPLSPALHLDVCKKSDHTLWLAVSCRCCNWARKVGMGNKRRRKDASWAPRPSATAASVRVKKNTQNGSVCEEARDSRSHGPRAPEGQDQDQLLWQRQDQVRPRNKYVDYWRGNKRRGESSEQTRDKFGFSDLSMLQFRSFIILC